MSDDKKIVVQRQIDEPAQVIFNVLTDPRRHKELDGSGFVRGVDNPQRITKVGDVFTVRYPAGFPARFVIVADDDSPWARSLRCGRLQSALDAAQRNLDFAPGDARSQRGVEAARREASAAGC